MKNPHNYSIDLINKAMEIDQDRKLICGNNCSNPPQLISLSHKIDLKDNVTAIDGSPILLDKNPSVLLKDKYLKRYYELCDFAYKGKIYPNDGGFLDQPTEFMEFYRLYLTWATLPTVEKDNKG